MRASQPATADYLPRYLGMSSKTQTLLAGPLALGLMDEAHAVQGPVPPKSQLTPGGCQHCSREPRAGSWELGAGSRGLQGVAADGG